MAVLLTCIAYALRVCPPPPPPPQDCCAQVSCQEERVDVRPAGYTGGTGQEERGVQAAGVCVVCGGGSMGGGGGRTKKKFVTKGHARGGGVNSDIMMTQSGGTTASFTVK